MSFAWQDSASPDSDVDLVVCLPFRGSATDKVVEIRGRVEAPFPMDLLVWRPAEERKQDGFTRSILSEGKIMYEASNAWMTLSSFSSSSSSSEQWEFEDENENDDEDEKIHFIPFLNDNRNKPR